MTSQTAELSQRHCKPCEGGVPRLSAEEVEKLLKDVPQWHLTPDMKKIRREWTVKDFATALDFFNRVGQVAEEEDHHPDLHLVGYRNVAIELSTHALGGLSENDFILAAKIDRLPVLLKK
jgi:4a-hydroxytetrahydrobiopterin dehydratase